MNVGWKDYLILALGGVLAGTYVALATGFRYDLLVYEIGAVVAVVLLLLAHFVLAGVKTLSLLLLVVLLAFAGAAASTYLKIRGGF